MKPLRAALLVILCAPPVGAQTVVATHTIRAQAILTEQDVALVDKDIAGTYVATDEVIGLEARRNLYAGRPIRIDDVGPPAIIERNQIVTLRYNAGGLSIATEARALGRAGVGDRVRVINLSSRTVVSGFVLADGTVSVSPAQTP